MEKYFAKFLNANSFSTTLFPGEKFPPGIYICMYVDILHMYVCAPCTKASDQGSFLRRDACTASSGAGGGITNGGVAGATRTGAGAAAITAADVSLSDPEFRLCATATGGG